MRKTAASIQMSVLIICSVIFIVQNFFCHSWTSPVEQLKPFFVDMSPETTGHAASSHEAFFVEIAKPKIEFVNVFVDVGIKEKRQRITCFFIILEAGAATTAHIHFRP